MSTNILSNSGQLLNSLFFLYTSIIGLSFYLSLRILHMFCFAAALEATFLFHRVFSTLYAIIPCLERFMHQAAQKHALFKRFLLCSRIPLFSKA